jgi:hypothetical protein
LFGEIIQRADLVVGRQHQLHRRNVIGGAEVIKARCLGGLLVQGIKLG